MTSDIPVDSKLSRIEKTESQLDEYRVVDRSDIDIAYCKTRDFATPEEASDFDFEECEEGFSWERQRQTTLFDRLSAGIDPVTRGTLESSLALGQNVWFKLSVEIPESMSGHPVYLHFRVDPIPRQESAMGPAHAECLCFRDGKPLQAFDAAHQELLLTESATTGECIELLVEVGTTTLWGLLEVERFKLETAHISARYSGVQELHREYKILNELRKTTSRDSPNWGKIVSRLLDVSHNHVVSADDPAEVEGSSDKALQTVAELKESLSSDISEYDVTAVGHAHIDLAWLWPWSETVRKGARTFSTALKLMEEYPSFSFLQSQPPLYDFQQDYYPDIHSRIQKAVDDGQWHPTGALWVESDINLASGESIARQFLFGKRFFREKYGIDPKIAFLPDVFGYSGSLPEIASAADCPYFFTQKIDWNETNEFPYTSFNWEGVGGSTILTHFPPVGDYNGDMSIQQIKESVTEHDENHIVDQSAYLIGWGDGGGGPTRDMIERESMISEVGSMPDISFGSLQEFFDELAEYRTELPVWSGELYLEKHRGTLTSQAEIKHKNRAGEQAMKRAELWSSLAHVTESHPYPQQDLEEAWKLLLFNQFHDILPGSSVPEVYADARREYEDVLQSGNSATHDAMSSLLTDLDASGYIAVANPLSWTRTEVIGFDASMLPSDVDDTFHITRDEQQYEFQSDEIGDTDYIFRASDVPGLGIQTFGFSDGPSTVDESPVSASGEHIENSELRVDIHEDGRVELYDKTVDRQVFKRPGNNLIVHPDYPEEFDAWDFEADLYQSGSSPEVTAIRVLEDGPVRASVSVLYETDESEIRQELSLEKNNKQLDIRTTVKWQEDEAFLRAYFPLDIQSTTATYDIQYANITRDTHSNTSWDKAKYEEPHHSWVDVSDRNYGVAVLNDSKYGVHVDTSTVSLSLLRAPEWPDENADRGQHEFTYSIKPHEGDLASSDVIESAAELNMSSTTHAVGEPVHYQPLSIDSESVIIDTVKTAEDMDDTIVIRAYESLGQRCEATINLDLPVGTVYESNIIEDIKREVEFSGDSFTVDFSKFDIKTYIITVDRRDTK